MAYSANQEEVAISNFDVYVINLFIMRPSRSSVTADSRNVFFFFFFFEPPAELFPGLKKIRGNTMAKNAASYVNTRYDPGISSPVLCFFLIKLIDCALLSRNINTLKNRIIILFNPAEYTLMLASSAFFLAD